MKHSQIQVSHGLRSVQDQLNAWSLEGMPMPPSRPAARKPAMGLQAFLICAFFSSTIVATTFSAIADLTLAEGGILFSFTLLACKLIWMANIYGADMRAQSEWSRWAAEYRKWSAELADYVADR